LKNAYYYLTEFGALNGLNKVLPNTQKKTFLVLDSSVCLDIVNIVNKRNINKESKRKALELINYSQKKSMPPFEIFALLELSFDKTTFNLNTDKFLDLSKKLKFAFQFPLSRIRKKEFNFSDNFYQPEKPNINRDASVFAEQILVHYCALLKIREIAHNGLGKQKAKKNLIEFIDWMEFELGLILGIEYQLAFQIFGGNNSFNAMIKENSTKEKALKTLWGTAWDLLHARVSRNSKQLSQILNEDVNSIFITNDKRLYELLSPQIEFATEFDRSKISITDRKENYPPNYNEDFINELNQRFIEIYKARNLQKVEYPNNDFIKNIILNLEKNVC